MRISKFLKTYKKEIGLYLASVFLFFLWKQFSSYPFSITISIGQYFLIIFIAFYILYSKKLKKFKRITYIVLFFLLGFYTHEYFFYNIAKKQVIFTRIKDDKFEIISSKSRDAINKRIKDKGLKVSRFPFVINDIKAKNFLKDGYKIVLWGDRKYINLSFKKEKNLRIKNIISKYKNRNFIVIQDIPNLKMPLEPRKATMTYISSLLYKLNKNEVKLKEIRYQNFNWTENYHKAYPEFLIGNYNLEKYSKNFEAGYLACAISAYYKALSYVRISDNEELYYAIKNNLMVSYYLKYANENKVILKKKAKQIFINLFPLSKTLNIKQKKILYKNRFFYSK